MLEFLEEVRKELEELEVAREELIKLTREIRINSTKAIAAVHSGRFNEAEERLRAARDILEKVKEFKKYPEIYYAITHDAMQEFVEAVAFANLVSGKEIPEFKDMGIETPPILTGLADLVGELRRYSLDLMRKGEVSEAEKCINTMEEIYSSLITFSFPEKLVPGLRHKVDVARQLIERTKSDWLAARLIEEIGQGLKKWE
ncbi:translin [Archaeoglobus veneficus]|uniref:Translin n=1 Tax=Archaeoglobus veneficus (strain DSM 11195 / SNP6) TaxID=693661 RepID=F2KT40_ARCVS|nr:translin [Archaeoglobus veneficus]AEA47070.1 Translin [Archaeoglobus veneficus SNP6]